MRRPVPKVGDLFLVPDATLGPGASPSTGTSGRGPLEPFGSDRLNAGEHTIGILWTLTGQRCDGFGPHPVTNCVPDGESVTTRTTFTVDEG
jgi:hypothetical protein